MVLKSIIYIFILTIFSFGHATDNPTQSHCVQAGSFNRTYCPQVGTSASCAHNTGLCHVPHGFVLDYGYGGYVGGAATRAAENTLLGPFGLIRQGAELTEVLTTGEFPNPDCRENSLRRDLTPLAGTLINGNAEAASYDEFIGLQICGGYHFRTGTEEQVQRFEQILTEVSESSARADDHTEELLFQTAVKDVVDFTTCQARFLSTFRHGTPERTELLHEAFRQFSAIKDEVLSLERGINSVTAYLTNQQDLHLAENNVYTNCAMYASEVYTPAAYDCIDRGIQEFEDDPQIREMRRELDELNDRMNILLARIPMANRPRIRDALQSLIRREGEVSYRDFEFVFGHTLNGLIGEVEGAVRNIMSIARVSPEYPDSVNFCVSDSLKRDLQRSGQLLNSMTFRGLENQQSDTLLRATNRYGAAAQLGMELGTLAVSLPLLFVPGLGQYQFARMALSSGRLANLVGNAGLRGQAAIRAGLTGVEVTDWAIVAESIETSCGDRIEFLLAQSDPRICNPAAEVAQMYNSASLLQCATSVIVPLAAAGITRAISRRVGGTAPDPEPIVVTGTRRRPERFLGDETREAVVASLRERNIMVGRKMDNSQMESLTPNDRLVLFESAAQTTLSRSEADKFFDIIADADGILGPRAVRRLRELLEDDMARTPEEVRWIMRRVSNNGLVEHAESILLSRIVNQFSRRFENLPPDQADILARKILDAKRAGVSDSDIRGALSPGGDRC